MTSTVAVLWIFLASGGIVYRDFPTLAACQATERILWADAQGRGDRRIERMICIAEGQ